MRSTARKPGRRTRRGYVMVLFAMLLFGIMALAALVIDLGLARLTQRQMQTAVDAAALEGMRGQTIVSDEERRLSAKKLSAWQFDDDLDADNGDDGIANDGGIFGAGPVVEFSGGAGDPALHASELLEQPDADAPVYKPVAESGPGLSENDSNHPNGDMVSGEFDRKKENPDFHRAGITNPAINEFVDGQSGIYVRRNFTVPPGATAPNAFLVRMRRTDESLAEDVGTSGPVLPYLFGRGSLINRDAIGNGISVRATAIASAEPAVMVGVPVSLPDLDEGVMGAIDVGYEWDDWTGDANSPVGLRAPARRIGEMIVRTDDAVGGATGYCAIIKSIGDVDRVIGFGVILDGVPLHEGTPIVALENASSRLSDAWIALGDLGHLKRDEVIAANQAFKDKDKNGLLAPVLVR